LASLSISVVIPCFNEEDNIRACLESVKWANEILLVDSFSADRTLDIAAGYTQRILQREYKSHADQLNWAIPQVHNEWVLVVDADERVPEELAAEIQSLDLEASRVDGFWIKRVNYLFGKQMYFSGWGRDTVMRLFRRDVGRKENKRVHAEFKVPNAGQLRHPIRHFPMKSIETLVENRFGGSLQSFVVDRDNPIAEFNTGPNPLANR